MSMAGRDSPDSVLRQARMRTATTSNGAMLALIYTRVSTDEQASNGQSLDVQLADCRRYAAGRDGWMIGDEYQDVLSGKRDDRPHYQRLLADVRRLRAEGRRVAIVLAALDRLGRDIQERVRCWRELSPLGAEFHSAREGGLVHEFVFNIMASVAQEESRRLGERVLASRDHLARNGWKPSGRVPWGYQWREATKEERVQGAPASVLDTDPISAPYVVEAFRLAATTHSVQAVARWVAGLPPSVRGGRNLRYCVVRDVLSAGVYIGRVDDRTESDVLARPLGRWPRLIDEATWLAVQARIASHRHMPRQATGRFLLTGLLRCSCDSRMVGMNTRGRTPKYACTARMRGAVITGVECRSHANAAQVEDGVMREVAALVERFASRDDRLRSAVRRVWQALGRSAPPSAGARQRQALVGEAARARKRLTDAARLLVDGALDKAGYEALRDDECARLHAAEEALARLGPVPSRAKATLPDPDEVLRRVGGWAGVMRSGSIPAKRELLGLLIAKVTPERVGWGRYRPVIEWTQLGAALRSVLAGQDGTAA